ncbi:MAG: anaerobic ribonucleoside-triphosphate reductase activating protein [Parcubacteria group bacterium]|nr:anaerobic ribonucleoside-triphosphate reductase activating protein [Parcubacteria group bacterium]
MLISGIQKLTLIDFPDTPACIVFTLGCNFRCGMCHNPEFVLTEKVLKLKDSCIPEEAFFEFLNQRKGMIEGVVITGGEPTIMYDLIGFIEKIKEMGFKVKLDSNGSRPDIIEKIIQMGVIDYIAMDIKITPERYKELTPRCVKPEKIKQSIRTIINSGIDHEFRTTMIKEFHDIETLKKMASEIQGAQRIYLQPFRPENTLDPAYKQYESFSNEEMENIAHTIFNPHVGEVGVRE